MIHFKLDTLCAECVDQQIAIQVREGVATGRLNAGEPMPQVEELALQLGVDPAYVRCAYLELEDENYIEVQRASATSEAWFVNKDASSSAGLSLLARVLIQLTSNAPGQKLLARVVDRCHFLMGIGAGGYVPTSGEWASLRALAQRGIPPYTIIDGGAYRGWFVDLVKQNLQTEPFEVHCFEPCASTFRLLERKMSQDSRIRVNQGALGAEAGVAPLYYDGQGSGRASLTKLNLRHRSIEFTGSELVRVDTIDDYCDRQGIPRIHLLKLDIEGHEFEALSGAMQMFRRGAIDMVSFELGKCAIDARRFFKDFFYFFQNAGMTISRMTPNGYLLPIHGYHEVHEQFGTTNYLAVKAD
jgi:FkbM family methyltransferase